MEHTQKYILLLLDSPGLVDGDMSYPFDVNEAILWLSELCDLVFVFFDPIGQVNNNNFPTPINNFPMQIIIFPRH